MVNTFYTQICIEILQIIKYSETTTLVDDTMHHRDTIYVVSYTSIMHMIHVYDSISITHGTFNIIIVLLYLLIYKISM
jgi:hypothetical protein